MKVYYCNEIINYCIENNHSVTHLFSLFTISKFLLNFSPIFKRTAFICFLFNYQNRLIINYVRGFLFLFFPYIVLWPTSKHCSNHPMVLEIKLRIPLCKACSNPIGLYLSNTMLVLFNQDIIV